MTEWLARHVAMLSLFAALGAATLAGLLFAFSNFAMRALSQLPPASGMDAMQRINVEIQNPLFLFIFVVTPLLYLLLGIAAFDPHLAAARWWLVGAAACYIVGVVGVTAVLNIPMNNALAVLKPEAAASEWPAYVSTWTTYNHVRTAFAFIALALTILGVFETPARMN